MNAIRILIGLALVGLTNAEELTVTVLASLDSERIAATGMKSEVKTDMPDFTITYLRGPKPKDVIGIYEGGHPSPLSARGTRLGEVKDNVAGQSVVWTCWSQEVDGAPLYGAELVMPSKRTVATLPDTKKTEFVEQFHVFVMRSDLKALAVARKLAGSILKKGPNAPLRSSPTEGQHR